MPLHVTSIDLLGFRSYERFSLQLDQHLTLITGRNGVGKTNIIEALQLTTAAESFRRPQWNELVKWGSDRAEATLGAEGDGRVLEIRLSISEQGKKEFSINGKIKRRIADVVGLLPSVVFTPDDLRLVKDSAEKRRAALDSLGVQISPAYLKLKRDYERILKQRNALLRDERLAGPEGESWTVALVEVGARFYEARKRLFDRLAEAMVHAHSDVAPSFVLDPRYIASWDRGQTQQSASGSEQAFTAEIAKRRAEEIARKTTLVGPHRDEIVFLLDGRDARAFGSQGQQRTIALSWKLAEVRVVNDISGQPPLLLLDDVMSELDEQRRTALTQYVGTAAQTVVTAANTGYFSEELLERAKVVRLG